MSPNKQTILLSGEGLPQQIIEQLKKANDDNKGDFRQYLLDVERIFGLDPIPSITTEQKHFIAGFLEGEGSINVSAKNLKSAKFGIMVDPEFSVTQHVNGISQLHKALNIFKTGRVRLKSGSNATMVLTIDNRQSLLEKVIPFYETYVKPNSSPFKNERLSKFKEILVLMNEKKHQDQTSFRDSILLLWDGMRMQKGQSNEAFASLQDAQDYVDKFVLNK